MTRRRRWWTAVAVVLALVGAALAARLAVYAAYPFPYRDIIEEAAREYGFDPFLIAAVIRTESRFRPDAVSPPGARGLMQLMPDTARQLAAKDGYASFDDDMLFDPRVNVQLGTQYLAELRSAFDGSLPAALAAYNGGRRNVRSWLAEGVWDGTFEHAERVPFLETRRFLERVHRAHRIYAWLYRGE
ncbi:MAG: lytic transglycosylase domain-containing protein [Clostridia bacterium]|nr:lytic transglycosylase domain-containing protein [Clostridia bacterium]